jgi:hypothetical protein
MKLNIVALFFVFFLCSCSSTGSHGMAQFGAEYFGLPACEGSDKARWHNCATIASLDLDDRGWLMNYNEWKNGKAEGRAESHYTKDSIKCTYFIVNQKTHGEKVCTRHLPGEKREIVSREFYVDGELSQEKTMQLSISEFQKKCEVLGFTKGTDAFAECSLRLMELAERSNGPSQVGQQEYNRIQQQNTDAQRLEGLKQMLEGVQQGIDATKPKTQRTDAACVQKCLSDGSMMSYCKSFCSY